MNKHIIIIEGYLASGKSTFARLLSSGLNVPYLIKDTFKEALCTSVSINSRAESSQFSAITFDAMMYVVERFMETGHPIIIEGNFVPAGVKDIDESDRIMKLINRYSYKSLVFKFVGDTQVLHERFVKREKSPERGKANTMFSEVLYHDFDTWCRSLDGFNIDEEIIKIDTTDFTKIDYTHYIEKARLFMSGEAK
ncbi:MAG: AAA family ATPase [Defluviitaleaceae bacterium]|nr:AAA family ATPase [Defluviitaleaceae bacterium]